MSQDDIDAHQFCPSIPTDAFDWVAVRPGYEPGDPIGYGRTKEAAIQDLQEQT